MNSLRLAAIFTDHMVLCREKNVRIFGEAADGARVSVSLAGQSVKTTAYQGRFEAVLAPMPAGGPHTLSVSDGNSTLTLTDVLIGDVYLAGGQSNMEWALEQARAARS